jgi:hypothetical protein
MGTSLKDRKEVCNMKKEILFVSILIVSVFVLTAASWAGPLTPDERKATLDFLASLQNDDGGYRAAPAPGPSELGATSNTTRAIQNLGGEAKNKDATIKYIMQFAHESGGFAEKPGGAPDIRSTWSAASALSVLRGSAPPNADKIISYLSATANPKSLYPDLYFSAGALEYMKMTSPKAQEWVAAFEATRKPDGSYGEGVDNTAHAVVTSLRLGGSIKDPAATGKFLKAAQRQSGGFEGQEKVVDLAATYTIMRALAMLKDKPNLETLYQYVSSRRNPDGGYGLDPGKPSNVTGTYRASSLLRWADQLGK